MTGPEKYLNIAVPNRIRELWWTWEGVDWRIDQHLGKGNLYPPDQRFGVAPPEGMCDVHRGHWHRWRNRKFAGIEFPGTGPNYTGGPDAWEFNRWGWDRQTREQMRQVEQHCLSGRSVQCGKRRVAA